VLRERFGRRRAVKDGCSPQGQCGCCTVWVDGSARAACVTPARRVAGRSVTTLDGLDAATRDRWASAFADAGASQCGFCTPGIVMRLAALEHKSAGAPPGADAVAIALVAHLCRCTGWQSIVEAAAVALGPDAGPGVTGRDPLLTAWRAQIEGPAFQSSGPSVVLGGGGFADDTAPAGAVVAMPGSDADWVVAPTLAEARRRSHKVQGRRGTAAVTPPLVPPPGEWLLTLATSWVEPAYLEPDASWCLPGGHPASPLANGGAFGGKRRSPVPDAARDLADRLGVPVRALWTREDVVRHGAKRPPVAVGVDAAGRGVLRAAIGAGPSAADFADAVAAGAPGLAVEPVVVPGPPTSADLRAAGWAEAAVVSAVLPHAAAGRSGPGIPVEVEGRHGGRARVVVGADGAVSVEVWAGAVLDEVTLRSYCLGAVHQALGWVRHEGIAVGPDGEVHDLTVRSFGILTARQMPPVTVVVHPGDRWPVNGSDAVLAATAAAAWLVDGLAPEWPTRRRPGKDAAGGRGARRREVPS